MNKRIAKKKITHNVLVILWINNYKANFNAYCRYKELICNDTNDKDLYNNALMISSYFMNYDYTQAYKIVHNVIKESLFKKVVNELLKIKNYDGKVWSYYRV